MRTTLMLATPLLATLTACASDDSCDPSAPNTICTIAGNGDTSLYDDGVPARESGLYIPFDVAVAPGGALWVSDAGNYRVREIRADGVIYAVVGNGTLGDSPAPGAPSIPAVDAELDHVSSILFADGYAYLAAFHNSRVKRVDLATMQLENFAGRGRRTYFDGDGGPALDASLDLPAALAVSPTGAIAITDQQNQVIREVRSDGTIHRLAGTCIADREQPCAPGDVPQACPGSEKLVCGDPATACATPCSPAYGGDGGPALDARFGFEYGATASPNGHLVYDRAGGLVIADTSNDRIRRIDPSGVITTIAGTGVAGYAGDGGPATAAQLHGPVDLELADDGTLYFTDVYNDCVRKIDPAGTISRVAGVCGERDDIELDFTGDGGDPLDAHLSRPYGIALDGARLYIADTVNDRVRVVNLR